MYKRFGEQFVNRKIVIKKTDAKYQRESNRIAAYKHISCMIPESALNACARMWRV